MKARHTFKFIQMLSKLCQSELPKIFNTFSPSYFTIITVSIFPTAIIVFQVSNLGHSRGWVRKYERKKETLMAIFKILISIS